MNIHHASTQSPKISVILVDGSYRPHFEVISSLQHQTMSSDDYEVLWVEYYDQVKPELQEKIKGYPHFHIFTLNQGGIYHSSLCFNFGITHARGEVLVIADADVLVEENFLESVWLEHQTNERLVMYIFRMDEPRRLAPFCFAMDYLKSTCVLTNPSNFGGCLTVRKKWLLAINGYEQFEIFRTGGDHANGFDIATRFKNLGLHIMWHPYLRLYHPWHPHKPDSSTAYPPQHKLIENRARNLEVLAYRGINPALDREIPAHLQALLDDVLARPQ